MRATFIGPPRIITATHAPVEEAIESIEGLFIEDNHDVSAGAAGLIDEEPAKVDAVKEEQVQEALLEPNPLYRLSRKAMRKAKAMEKAALRGIVKKESPEAAQKREAVYAEMIAAWKVSNQAKASIK